MGRTFSKLAKHQVLLAGTNGFIGAFLFIQLNEDFDATFDYLLFLVV